MGENVAQRKNVELSTFQEFGHPKLVFIQKVGQFPFYLVLISTFFPSLVHKDGGLCPVQSLGLIKELGCDFVRCD